MTATCGPFVYGIKMYFSVLDSYKQDLTKIKSEIFKRPGVAGTVLQSPSSLIH